MLELFETDGGRKQAGFRGDSRNDDLVCALATLYEESYRKWYMVVGMQNKLRRLKPSARPLKFDYSTILAKVGFVKVTLPPKDFFTFSDAYTKYGNCIVVDPRGMAYCLANGIFYGKSKKDQARKAYLPGGTGAFEYIERMTRHIWVKPKGEIRYG